MTKTERVQLIEHMLSEVEDSLYERKQTNEFIESIREQFDARGDLSDKQIDALRRFYDRV